MTGLGLVLGLGGLDLGLGLDNICHCEILTIKLLLIYDSEIVTEVFSASDVKFLYSQHKIKQIK